LGPHDRVFASRAVLLISQGGPGRGNRRPSGFQRAIMFWPVGPVTCGGASVGRIRPGSFGTYSAPGASRTQDSQPSGGAVTGRHCLSHRPGPPGRSQPGRRRDR
jgi:hypothetical protein